MWTHQKIGYSVQKRPVWQRQIQATLSIQVLMTKPRFKRQTILLWPVRIYRQKGILIENFLSLNSIRLQKNNPHVQMKHYTYILSKKCLKDTKRKNFQILILLAGYTLDAKKTRCYRTNFIKSKKWKRRRKKVEKSRIWVILLQDMTIH